MGRPFQVAPPPRTAENRFSPSGSSITPDQQLVAAPAGDGDAVDGQALEEVGGAVQGIDQPLVLAVPLTRAAPLLGQDAVVGEALADLGEDGGLALLVRLGDEVVLPLAPHLEPGVAEIAGDDPGASLGAGEGGLEEVTKEVVVHGGGIMREIGKEKD